LEGSCDLVRVSSAIGTWAISTACCSVGFRFGQEYQLTDDSVSSEYKQKKTRLRCPCGEFLQGDTTEALVSLARAHLEEVHPDLADKYSDADILWLAY
jgi:hypothetical protein